MKSLYYKCLYDESPIGIDLFCGAGGLSLGFCQAGGRPIAAVDSDFDSITTYRRMFPICGEIRHGTVEKWTPHIEREKINEPAGQLDGAFR